MGGSQILIIFHCIITQALFVCNSDAARRALFN
jgi:hypothetical protein